MSAAVLLTVYAAVVHGVGLMLLENPMIWPINVGGVFINLLLLAYALPAGASAAAVLMRSRAGGAPPMLTIVAALPSFVALAYVTVEIRRLYHGPIPSGGHTTDAEQYTYSIAWLGIRRGSCSASAFCSIRSAHACLLPRSSHLRS